MEQTQVIGQWMMMEVKLELCQAHESANENDVQMKQDEQAADHKSPLGSQEMINPELAPWKKK